MLDSDDELGAKKQINRSRMIEQAKTYNSNLEK